jgi:ATP-dependent DNA ligase
LYSGVINMDRDLLAAVLDGELVLWLHGRLDVTALQLRLHPAESRAGGLARSMPATYVVFDVLEIAGADLRRRPYGERRAHLEDLLGHRLPHGLVLMPASDDPAVAEQWLINHSAAGIEGVVAKRCTLSYRPGKTRWHKIHTRVTAEAVVDGVLGSIKQPEALVVGLPDEKGRLRMPGARRRCHRRYARSCPSFPSSQAGHTRGPRSSR